MPQTGHSFWLSDPSSSPSSPTEISAFSPDFLGGSYRYFCAHSSHRWCSSNCSSLTTSVMCIVAAFEHFWHFIAAAPVQIGSLWEHQFILTGGGRVSSNRGAADDARFPISPARFPPCVPGGDRYIRGLMSGMI